MTQVEKVVEINIDSKLDLIEVITLAADHLAKIAGFDDEQQYRINLSVRESLANAIEHGNKFATDKIVAVRFTLTSEKLHITIRDHGEGFDPTSLPDPLDPQNLLSPAGRGILYMRAFMDEVELIRHPEGGMQITLVKQCQPTPVTE